MGAFIINLKVQLDYITGSYVPYSLQELGEFFNVPCYLVHWRCEWQGLQLIVLIKEHENVIAKAADSRQLFKDPKCWSGLGLEPQNSNHKVTWGSTPWATP